MYTYELPAIYDHRQSFGRKARVEVRTDSLRLISYSTHVATIFYPDTPQAKALVTGTYSATTLRHIKEFLRQNGFKAETKTQILADYGPEQDLHPAFDLHHKTQQRVKVETAYLDDEGNVTSTWVRCGRVGKTTGVLPSYLLVARSNCLGSSDLIAPDNERRVTRVIGVQMANGKYRTVAAPSISDRIGCHELRVRRAYA